MSQAVPSILLYENRGPTGELSTFTVGVGTDGGLVFNEGTFYPRLGSSPSREVDEYLVVPVKYLDQLRKALALESDDMGLLVSQTADALRKRNTVSLEGARGMLKEFDVTSETPSPWYDRDDF